MVPSIRHQGNAVSAASASLPPTGPEAPAFMTVSPAGWQLPSCLTYEESPLLEAIGLPKAELERRAHQNTYEWLVHQFSEDQGAFHGHYDARGHHLHLPQTVNLIAPFQLIAAYDRYSDNHFLEKAQRCSDWLETNMVESHPMSLVLGGVRDNIRPGQLWTKYTADYVIQNLALHERTHNAELLARAIRSSKFLHQSQNHHFAPKYDHETENWSPRGWQSFGRVIVALILLSDVTQDEQWLDRAVVWADYAIRLQSSDGCFHLIYETYYSSDIAADEIRAFILLGWRTKRRKYLDAGLAFADWHLRNQLPNGAWPLSIDRWGVTVGEYVGPGDIPNIAIAMLMAHRATGAVKYLVSAVQALRYSLTQQLLPDQEPSFSDDPLARWGFWSWDPRYDFTMSSDQSTHHVRGYWFFLDYFFSLDPSTQAQLAATLHQDAAGAGA